MTGRTTTRTAALSAAVLAVLAAGGCGLVDVAGGTPDTEMAIAATPPAPGVVDAGVHQVVRVVDGDTIDVDDGAGGTVRVRLLGIDTPETVDPDQGVQCYGPEASARAHELLAGRTVALATDPTQDERDRYGRLLAYVTTDDGVDVGLKLLKEGLAREYTYDDPYQRRDAYTAAQNAARDAGEGLWGAC